MKRDRPWSIVGRLRREFAIVAAGGAVVLAIFLFDDFGLAEARTRARYGGLGILHEVIDHVLFPIAVLLAPLALAAGVLIERSLAPLRDAAERARAATGRERGFRVAADEFPAEAQPFGRAVNELLERIDAAAQRQERFAADIAHELKTPLSVAMLELHQIGTIEAERISADLAALNRLIEQLLTLAQVDALVAAPRLSQSFAPEDAALDAIHQTAAAAAHQGVRIALQITDAPLLLGHREAVSAAIRNLIENAVRVTPEGGEIVVDCGPGPTICVIDGGKGIEPDRFATLCDRYRRGDHASRDGAGLGLSIVAQIMAMHGGRVASDAEKRAISLQFPSDTVAVD